MQLTFLGAARTVTGSKHLLDTGTAKVLVDGGLFQGLKELRERNWRDLPIRPSDITADRPDARASRSLRLPAAARRARIPRPHLLHARHPGSLPHRPARLGTDSGRRCRERQPSRVLEALAGAAALHRGGRVPRDHAAAAGRLRPADSCRRRRRSGLHQRRPSARIGLRAHSHRRQDDSLRRRSRPLRAAGAARSDAGRRKPTICSSSRPTAIACTKTMTTATTLAKAINDDGRARRRVIIPAFAVGRVEELLYWIQRLEEQHRIPVLPVYVDSPMAIEALKRYTERLHELDEDMQPERHDEKAPHGPAARGESPEARRREARQERQVAAFCDRALPHDQLARRNRSSSRPRSSRRSSSRRAAWRPADACCTISRPRCPIRATRRLRRLPGRGHARPPADGRRADGQDSRSDDSRPRPHREGRLDVRACRFAGDPALARRLQAPPRMTFLVHGELEAMNALQATITAKLGWPTMMPQPPGDGHTGIAQRQLRLLGLRG